MTQMLLPTVLLLILAGASPACAADAQPPDRQTLASDLDAVRADLTKSQTDLQANNKQLWQEQHQIEYSDPEIVKVREEIVALEKQLIEKRKSLRVRLALKPEIKKIEAARKKLFNDVQSLREQEAALQREIAARDSAPATQE